MFHVVNLREYRGEDVVRVDRGTILGNPFKIGRDGTREEVISKYRAWLWAQVQLRGPVYKELQRLLYLEDVSEVALGCWCAPLPCHAEVIKACLEWLVSSGDCAV